VRWLWPGRIPRGKLTLIIGDPDRGKSCVTLDGAARVSTGKPWPDGTPAPSGAAVLLTAEDGLADTVRPRLDAMGGDPSRVHILTAIRTGDRERGIDLSLDLPHLEAALTETGAILVVIDPVSAYLGKTDSWRDADVRTVLAPLAALAEETGVAVVGIMHLTKDRQRQALYRAQGNISFVAAARAVFAVAEDRENPERRLLLPVKLNIARKPPGLAFRLVEAGTAVRVDWEPGPVDVDVEDALAEPEPTAERSKRDEATDFLREVLADGPVAATEVKRQARATGIAGRTLSRAKRELGVKSEKTGFREDWTWSLPPKNAKAATSAIYGNGGTLGILRELEAPAEVEL
jgi:putative DNA primase/helicase